MRTRCTRLARLARGEPVDSADTDMTAGGETRRDGNGKEGQAERQTNDWEEATVQEAAVAMELGRRRALENEVERCGFCSAGGWSAIIFGSVLFGSIPAVIVYTLTYLATYMKPYNLLLP